MNTRLIKVLLRRLKELRCCENCDCSDIHIEGDVKTIQCYYPKKLGKCHDFDKWRKKTPQLRINIDEENNYIP